MRVRVTVPASGGNTGPAFDSLGVAYDLLNEVVLDTDRPGEVAVEGEGAEALRAGEPNLVRRSIERLDAETGRKLPPCGLRLVNRIPFGRGLGSSAAAGGQAPSTRRMKPSPRRRPREPLRTCSSS